MQVLEKPKPGDKVAIVSPSFAAPAYWPNVYALGLERLQQAFGLIPVEYPSTTDGNASTQEKARDLSAAFDDREIRAVFSTLGGDIQVTYVKALNKSAFIENPKPFFGYSDNSHLANFLFLNQIPSYYGGSILTQFAMQGAMDNFTTTYLKHALFHSGEVELTAAPTFNDVDLSWDDPNLLTSNRRHEANEGWHWDGNEERSGLLWGGCLESVDEMLRHATEIPSLNQFENVVLMLETSEEIPSKDYVSRVLRAFGERGILERVNGLLMGRPKAWSFENQQTAQQKGDYREQQRHVVLEMFRQYNGSAPVVQNLDFGHTDPQIPMPYGNRLRISPEKQSIWANF